MPIAVSRKCFFTLPHPHLIFSCMTLYLCSVLHTAVRVTQVTCKGGRLPERFRTAARALLQSSDGRGVSFGSQYVSVRAEIQEPTVYISTAKVDVDTAYLGVPLTRQVRMVNLSNLEAS